MARWSWQERSVGFAQQSDLTTKATSGFVYMPAEVSLPEFARTVEDFQFGTMQAGASEPPVIGSKHGGSFTMRYPLQSMKTGYNPVTYTGGISAANNIIAPGAVLFQHAIGGNTAGVSSNQDFLDGKLGYDEVYDASGTAAGSSTATTNVNAGGGGTGSNYDEGNLLFASTATTDPTPLLAWIKSISVDAISHAEAAQTAATTADKVWPTNTTAYSGDEPNPLTFRIVGDAVEFGIVLIGCVPTSWTFTGAAGSTPTIEIAYVYTDKIWDTSIGLLKAKSLFERVPPALGGRGGYVAFGTATAAAERCGVHDFTISGESELHFVPCHSKAQGFSDFVVTGRSLSASFAIDHQSGDTVDGAGEHVHEADFVAGTYKSLSLFVGTVPGTVFACFLPSWHISAQPTLEDVDGVIYHRLTLRAGEHISDKTPAALDVDKAADSIFRIAFA